VDGRKKRNLRFWKPHRGDQPSEKRTHAVLRARQRYRLKLTGAKIGKLKAQVRQGKARLLEKQPDGVSVYSAFLRGSHVRFVYDEKSQFLITVLPPEREQEKPGE